MGKEDKSLELTYEKLIEFKKQKNYPLIVSKNGKIIHLNANKVASKIKDRQDYKNY